MHSEKGGGQQEIIFLSPRFNFSSTPLITLVDRLTIKFLLFH